MSEALRAVRGSLGADALIAETKNLTQEQGGGVEITALADGTGPLDGAAEPQAAAPVTGNADPMAGLRLELAALKSMLGWLAPGLRHQDPFVRRLMAHGLSAELIARLAESVRQMNGGEELGRWHRAIAGLVNTGGEIDAARDRLALIGPTGAGKTLNLIKLTVAELARRPRRLGWIGMDHRGLAGADALGAYAGILGVRYERAADRKGLKESLAQLSDCDLVLIDTPGINPRDPDSVKAWARCFHGVAEVRRALVLSAGTNGSDLSEWIAYLRPLGAQSLFFTKLDECRYFGPLLNAVLAAGVPVSYLSVGQNLSGDLAAARPQVFASLLLTGDDTDD